MDAFQALVDERIREAMAAGLFDRLPGAGKPLELEDLSGVPQDLRAGYILLKSAGALPEELELKQELLRLDDLISACDDDARSRELRRQRANGALRLSMMLERRGFGPAHAEYFHRCHARMTSRSPSPGLTHGSGPAHDTEEHRRALPRTECS